MNKKNQKRGLTQKQIERIKSLRKKGVPKAKVADIVGCGLTSIWKYQTSK